MPSRGRRLKDLHVVDKYVRPSDSQLTHVFVARLLVLHIKMWIELEIEVAPKSTQAHLRMVLEHRCTEDDIFSKGISQTKAVRDALEFHTC